jgi:hypothetical protein
MEWAKIINRAKEKGDKFLIVDMGKMDSLKVYFTEKNECLPDAITAIVVHAAKAISSSSKGKYRPTSVLESLLTNVTVSSRVILENYEKASTYDDMNLAGMYPHYTRKDSAN